MAPYRETGLENCNGYQNTNEPVAYPNCLRSAVNFPLSRRSIQSVSWLSLSRHCPPTFRAGKSLLRIIRCKVRVETCNSCAASARVSSLIWSKFRSIGDQRVNRVLRAKLAGSFRNADANSIAFLTMRFASQSSHESKSLKYRNGQTLTPQGNAGPQWANSVNEAVI
jgi:hypothetical protein